MVVFIGQNFEVTLYIYICTFDLTFKFFENP